MQAKKLPPLKYLRECFEIVDTATESYLVWRVRPLHHFATEGAWKATNTRFAGKRAGKLNTGKRDKDTPYYVVFIYREQFYVHRVMWKLRTGKDPGPNEVDHENGDSLNNKPKNHRLVSKLGNLKNKRTYKNSRTGIKGVHRTKHAWTANIRAEGRLVHLGSFDSAEAATAARKQAERKYGYHEHGR